jgi:hypothetical protein
MKLNTMFQNFCDKHKYIGKIDFDITTKEFSIVITKDTENAGVFLSSEELSNMSYEHYLLT